MALPEYPYVDIEDYLALENGATCVRYEYVDGTLRMLASGSPNHSIIASNITALLHSGLRKKPCIVYNPDVRLRLAPPRYFHPSHLASPSAKMKQTAILSPSCQKRTASPGTSRLRCQGWMWA